MSSRRKRAKKQPPKRGIIPIAFFLVIVALLGLIGFSSIGAYAVAQSWLVDLPAIDDAEAFNLARKSEIIAADGTLLAEFYAQDREPVTADQVSPNMFNAMIAIEDERFWEHNGVDYYGIARAVVYDILGDDLQGASTITQQFVRQTILKDEATDSTLKRKVREAYLATELEKMYSKQEILLMYLNTINFGDGAWGVQSAAQHYFSKDVSQLTVPEAAVIAGIPQNPTYNNPVAFPDNALSRRNMVLDRMYVNGYITAEEREQYTAQDLGLNLKKKSTDGIYAQPYFVSYVREMLLNYPEKFQVTSDMVFKGGLKIYTTIDLDKQYYAEMACQEKEWELYEKTGDWNIEVSLCAVDPKTGHIMVMRGGKDFYADQFNTCWQMQRQAGSTFKVFMLVAALEQGYSPSTQVSGASPITIDLGDGSTPWRVENYQGGSYGMLTMANAIQISSNTAFARIVRKIGPESLVEMAHRMGIKTDIQTVMAAVLGSEGVNTLEMASAFATLANGGVYREPTPITRIVDYNGVVIYDHEDHDDGVQVISPEVAYAANEILKGVVTSGTGTQANFGWQVAAGKTGTADDYTDSWFVGYTPQLSCAVWIGSRLDQYYIEDNVGGANCCPVWREFMENSLWYYEPEDFPYAGSPVYDPKASFLTAEEKKELEEKEKKAKEDEAKRLAEEKAAADAARKAAEDAAIQAALEAANGGGGSGDPGTGGP